MLKVSLQFTKKKKNSHLDPHKPIVLEHNRDEYLTSPYTALTAHRDEEKLYYPRVLFVAASLCRGRYDDCTFL